MTFGELYPYLRLGARIKLIDADDDEELWVIQGYKMYKDWVVSCMYAEGNCIAIKIKKS